MLTGLCFLPVVNNAPLAVSCEQGNYSASLDATVNYPLAAWDINEKSMLKVIRSEDMLEGTRANPTCTTCTTCNNYNFIF